MLPETGMDASGVALSRTLRRIAARLCAFHALRGAAAGFGFAALCAAVLLTVNTQRSNALGIGLFAGTAAAAAVIWRTRIAWSVVAAAERVERTKPESRNVVFTAAELLRHPDRSRPWVRDRVVAEAAAIARSIDARAVVPLTMPLVLCALAAATWAVTAVRFPTRRPHAQPPVVEVIPTRYSSTVIATITPPAYTGRPATTVNNPETIEALQNSSLRLVLSGKDRDWQVRFGSTVLPVRAVSGIATVDTSLDESGYIAIQRVAADGARRLIPVTLIPDRAPVVRVEAPGKDLLLADARARIPLALSAEDDFGLASFELRYTRVSGSGEQFDFREGTLRLDVSVRNDRMWTARSVLALRDVGLAPGDALIYRAVAHDRRPGTAGEASSDTYFVEIAGRDQISLPGFELPPDQDRYALSQQMIVVKIQRLRARESSLPREALQQETASLIGEQRAVRANFIFLMGGEVEDEEREAEQSTDIQEGRLRNAGRQAINQAIHDMSRTELALGAIDTRAALTAARAAVGALQRAFGHSRYILRTLAARGRIDPGRRLSGDLAAASSWQRNTETAAQDRIGTEARRLLVALLALAKSSGGDPDRLDEAVLIGLAEEVLQVSPGAPEWQQISTRVLAIRNAVTEHRSASGVLAAFGNAVRPLAEIARRNAIAPAALPGFDSVRSAWFEEHRRH